MNSYISFHAYSTTYQISSPKKENSVIVYSALFHSKPFIILSVERMFFNLHIFLTPQPHNYGNL